MPAAAHPRAPKQARPAAPARGQAPDRSAPLPLAVQVTKERVVAPPERWISVSDDALMEHFQGELCLCYFSLGVLGEEQAGDLGALLALLDGICAHKFLAMRRRLEADFEFFSSPGGAAGAAAAAAGQRQGSGRRALLRLSSIEAHERRFLSDFVDCMQRSHYRLLGAAEWEAAAAEAFLFTLPVAVDWKALDRHMLGRYWGDRPDQRALLPDLSDRILIFWRGFEPAKMRGRYLWHKVELLIGFFLLAPLWAALVWLLQLLGLKAPPDIPGTAAPSSPSPAADRTFKGVSTAATAAVKWLAIGRGSLPADGSLLQHDACTIIERRTMSRAFPSGRAVLARFFEVVELQARLEACFRDVVIVYRRKASRLAGGEGGEKEVLRDAVGPGPHNIAIKQFSGIPMADLEMVMPEKKIYVPPSVVVQLAVAAAVAVAGLLATLLSAGPLDWKVWGSALMLLGSRASQVYFQASSERNEIEREMNKLLFERLAASDGAVLHTLTDEMARQHIRECFLAFCVLLAAGKDLQAEDLDAKCERLLRRQWGLRLDFTAEAALPALCEWGLLERQPDGRMRARPLKHALVALDAIWDNTFQFDGAAAGEQQQAQQQQLASQAACAVDSPTRGSSQRGPAAPAAGRSSSSCCSSSVPPDSWPATDAREAGPDGEPAGGTAASKGLPSCALQLSAVPEGDEACSSVLSHGSDEQQDVPEMEPEAPPIGEGGCGWVVEATAAELPGAVEEGGAIDDVAVEQQASELPAASVEGSADYAAEMEQHADQLSATVGEGHTAASSSSELEGHVVGAAAALAAAWVEPAAEVPAGFLEGAALLLAPAADQALEHAPGPAFLASAATSSSDDEWLLRVPSPFTSATAGYSAWSAASFPAGSRSGRSPYRHSPSSVRLSHSQLRHLESLRRQRLAQEAEALEKSPN